MEAKCESYFPFPPPYREKEIKAEPMKSELVDTASEIVRDPQILINLVSKRVKQLNNGRAPFIKTLPSMGAADIALLEIIEGKIIPKGIEIFPLPKPEPVEDAQEASSEVEEEEEEEELAEVGA